jgi:hypothetical protein
MDCIAAVSKWQAVALSTHRTVQVGLLDGAVEPVEVEVRQRTVHLTWTWVVLGGGTWRWVRFNRFGIDQDEVSEN